MPIVFISDNYAEAVDNTTDLLVIQFRAVDIQSTPIPNTPVITSINLGGVIIKNSSSMTDSNGEGWVEVYRFPSIGNWGNLSIQVGEESGSIAVVLYNREQNPKLYIDSAFYYDNKFYITQAELKQNGLLLQTRFTTIVNPEDVANIYIGGFFSPKITLTPTTVLNFQIPPAILNIHVATPGEYTLFYSHNTPAENIYVPYSTTLVLTGDEVNTRLLPIVLLTQTPGYINVIDNLLGFYGVIPGSQPYIEVGDQWNVFYSLIDPSINNTSFIPVGNGIVSSTAETRFPIPARFFPAENNVATWFWYAITKPSGQQYISMITRFILDTQ